MKCTVVFASADRARSLHDTVASLLSQTRIPDEILISVPSLDHCLPETRALASVRVVTGSKGLTCQRNTAIESLSPGTELVLFLDDDMELRADYVENCVSFVEKHPDVVAMCGNVVADGTSRDAAVPRELARTIVRERRPDDHSFRELRGLYGCNMAVRAKIAKEVLFDERLRLYALFEDIDFGARCRPKGKVVSYKGCVAVHLAERSGRISHKRFGFAQVMNSLYLWKKGSLNHLEMANLLLHHLLGNVKGLIIPRKGRSRADRVRQLRGNVAAFATLFRSGAVPEGIEEIS